uniref:Uncharacterized protein n=1 Tax=Arundo donax TaxID=35708 RepID=A0A0A9C2Q5_ARUDO
MTCKHKSPINKAIVYRRRANDANSFYHDNQAEPSSLLGRDSTL